MTTTPMEPHEEPRDEVAAADPGQGAPDTAPGFGDEGVEPGDSPEQAPDDTPDDTPDGEPTEPPD